MSRLEIIHLRTAGMAFDSLARELRKAVGSELDEGGVVTVYRRCGLDTDVAVHITHDGKDGSASPSDLGLHLASALSAYGLVEHAVWEELA
jgi:hypothetical protein